MTLVIMAMLTILLSYPYLLYKSKKFDMSKSFVNLSAIICFVGRYKSLIFFRTTLSQM